ncbi:MAG: peroxiredoxin [Cellulomonas sp.]
MTLAAERPEIRVGESAPDFVLPDTHGTPVRLRDLRGTTVAVVFVPFAFTGICTGELCELRDAIGEFDAAGVRLLVVSCDPTPSQRAWAEHEGFGFDLLSDFWPHGAAAQAFGVFDPVKGRAIRGSFLIDDAGVVRWSVINPPGKPRDLAGYRAALAAL